MRLIIGYIEKRGKYIYNNHKSISNREVKQSSQFRRENIRLLVSGRSLGE